MGLSIHAQLKAMTYAALADLKDRAGGMAEHGSLGPLSKPCQGLGWPSGAVRTSLGLSL